MMMMNGDARMKRRSRTRSIGSPTSTPMLMTMRSLLLCAKWPDASPGIPFKIENDDVMAFTDFGIDNLIELIKMHRPDPMPFKS